MNGSVAASNRAAAGSFSFEAEKAIDNDRNGVQRARSHPTTLFLFVSKLGTFLRGTLLSTEKSVNPLHAGSRPITQTGKTRRKHAHANKRHRNICQLLDTGVA